MLQASLLDSRAVSRRAKGHFERVDDAAGDVVLDREEVSQFAVVALGREVSPFAASMSCAVIRSTIA